MVKNIFYVFRYFNPRSPQGGATMPYFKESLYIDISIHAPRKGERLPASLALLMLPVISIHAPRKGERQDGFRRRLPFVRISIHAPRKGERPSAEGALLHRGKISIHAPRKGERLTSCCSNFTLISSFQSTLPARGSDMLDPDWPGWEDVFQSTLPARGSDAINLDKFVLLNISIHAPRKGERHANGFIFILPYGISIHAPRKGERP